MRLHRLELTAFGPFAGTEEVDLDALSAGGLFLLEGPTGAGKSTVLDAITFALYGSTADSQGSPDRLRSHFAPEDAVPRVVLELTVGGERLRVTREPEHLRPKRRGQGSTLERARVHLERRTSEGWESVSSHVQEASTELRARLGLTRDQFTKVVLLPQGEFAAFLRADDDVRRMLLTQIFGTGLYDRVTRELEDRRAKASTERQAALHAVSSAVAVAAEAAALDGEDAAALAALDPSGRTARLAEVATALAQRHDRARSAEAAARAGLTAARAEADLLEERVRALDALAAAQARLDEHLAGTEEHRRRVAEHTSALAAVPVGVHLHHLDAMRRAADAARRAVRDGGSDLDVEALLAAGPEPLEAEARTHESLAVGLEPLVALEAALAERADDVARRDERRRSAQRRLAEVRAAQADLPERVRSARGGVDLAARAADGLDAAREAAARTAAALAAADDLDRLRPQLARARRLHEQRTRARLAAHEGWNDARTAHLDGIAAVLAATLVEGEACSVCGSTAHPHPARPAEDAVSADDVARAEAAYLGAQAGEAQARESLEELQLREARLRADSSEQDAEGLRVEHAACSARVEAAESAAARLPSLREVLETLESQASTLEAQMLDAVETSARAAADHEAAVAALDADRAAIDEARAGLRSVAERRSAAQAGADRLRALASAVRDAAAAVDRAEAAELAALGAARAAGFPGLAQARAAWRAPDDLAVLDAGISDWTARRAVLEAALADARLEDVDPAEAEAEPSAQRLIAARARAARAELDLRAATAESVTAEGVLRRFTAARAELTAAELDARRVVEATEAVTRLAGLAKGTTGSRRMTLTTYVLRRWFAQVVSAANLRLAAMSSGRYELERTDDSERRTERSGLGLRVLDRHTGASRSTSSLSGGETFYASLALALGLADVVTAEAGGVDLDTLFVDEGFGSLDADTLDQVMGVIDDLRDRGRVVGIVSHVADLKDRITERLEVRRRDPLGPSHLRVHA